MKFIKVIVGTIASIVAIAIATKIAAFILGLLGIVVAVAALFIKLAIIIGIVMLAIWIVGKVLSPKKSESF